MQILKKAAAFIFSLILVLSLFSGIALADEVIISEQPVVEEEQEEYVEVEEEAIADPIQSVDNDELLEEYIEVQLSTSNKPMYSVYGAGKRLTGTDRMTYDFLKAKAAQVASGEIADAQFDLSAADMGLQSSYTAEDLGLSALGTTSLTDEAKAAVRSLMPDLNTIVTALLYDCPYDFYWYDKATNGACGMSYGYSISMSSGTILAIVNPRATFSFTVAEEYANENGKYYIDSNNVSHPITVDDSKTTAVNTAVENINSIVESNADLSDYQKLSAYKDTIDDMVDYNHEAADDNNTPYGNPWQLIWVFDDDDSTKVVCEGYSKAFQYLCDLSNFKNSKVESRIVTGTMSGGTGAGGHMWNIGTMDDEKTYLVDVTNCDNGSIGYPDKLFLVGDANGSVSNGYSISVSGQGTISYSYDTDTRNAYEESKLTLAGSSYDPTPYLPENCFDYVVLDDGTAELTRFKQSIKEVEIPSEIDGYVVTSIGENAFYNDYGMAVTSISLPETLKSIGNYAFSGCSEITSIELPSGLSSIGNGAFNKCSALTSMTLPSGLASLGNSVFNNCSNLTEIIISAGVTNIDEYAFQGCSGLIEVNLPAGLINIGEKAFYSCRNLTSITIPKEVNTIGEYAFGYYYEYPNQIKLNDFIVYGNSGTAAEQYATANEFTFIPLDLADYSAVDEAIAKVNALERDLYTEESLQAVDDAVAAVVEGLQASQQETVDAMAQAIEEAIAGLVAKYIARGTCGATLTWVLDKTGYLEIIGEGEASEFICSNGEDWATYCKQVKTVYVQNGVTSIAEEMFKECSMMSEITLPDSIENIGKSAFWGCTSLKSIVLPEYLSSIEENTFYKCWNLESINIPSNVKSIKRLAFGSCGLESITFNEGLETIEINAFNNTYLKEVNLPRSVVSVSEFSFYSTTVYMYADSKAADCFAYEELGDPISGKFISPSEPEYIIHKVERADGSYYLTVADYLGTEMSIELPKRIDGIEVKAVEGYAFSKALQLQEVKIPDGYTHLKYLAFYTNNNLRTIYIPATVNSIHDNALEEKPTIQCYRGSYAETWANEHSCFVEPADDMDDRLLGHTFIRVEGKEPGCTSTGFGDSYYCIVCNKTIVEGDNIPATGHSWKFVDITFTEKEDSGYTAAANYVCENNEEHTQTRDAEVTVSETDASCTEAGTTTYTATVTAETSLDGEEHTNSKTVTGEVLGHDFGEWTVTTAATCTTVGEETRTCSRCGHTETREVAALGHDLLHHDAQTATCTGIGWSAYDTCSRCDYTTYVEVPATGHTEEIIPAVAATCTETGMTGGKKCSVCGEILKAQEIVPALGHLWDYVNINWQWTKADDSYSATAILICLHDSNHTGTVNADVTGPVNNVYIATITGADGKTYSDTKVVEPVEPDFYDDRIFGPDRYTTARYVGDRYLELSGKPFANVVVACGTNFPDALGGGYLAYVKDAPILLVTNYNEGEIADYIKKNMDPDGTVYLLGGTGVVSSSFENTIISNGMRIRRLGGADRYATNINILKAAGVSNEEILVCTGTGYADSLSASAAHRPILLVGDNLTEEQKQYLREIESNKFYLIGGTGAVKGSIENTLKNDLGYTTERIFGQTRYETSTAVADYFFDQVDNVVLAYAQNFPDGLSGGPLAMKIKAPILLVDSYSTAAASTYVKKSGASGSITLGGPTLISDAAIKKILGK